MKNNDRILKYLSDLMSPEEVREFENELKESTALNSKYMKIKEQLQSLNPETQEEGYKQYFINLVPNVRARFGNKNSKGYQYLKYLAPVMVVLLLYFLVPFRSHSLLEEQIRDLNDSSQTELLNLIDESVVFTDNNDVIETAISEQIGSDELNQLDTEYLNTNDLLEILSEEEVNQIYNTILKKEIL